MSEADADRFSAFDRVCREVVGTARAEISAEIFRAGHSCQIDVGFVPALVKPQARIGIPWAASSSGVSVVLETEYGVL